MSANFHHRLPQNVPGKFYIIDQCLDCDLCREVAPNNFKRWDEGGYSFVSKQPETPEELNLCLEVVQGCPLNAVGSDGDMHDWATPIHGDEVKPWWKFW